MTKHKNTNENKDAIVLTRLSLKLNGLFVNDSAVVWYTRKSRVQNSSATIMQKCYSSLVYGHEQ